MKKYTGISSAAFLFAASTLVTGCGTPGMNLKTTPDKHYMMMASLLQEPEIKEIVGDHPVVYSVRSDSFSSHNPLTLGAIQSNQDNHTILIRGDKGEQLVFYTLSQRNWHDWKVKSLRLLETTEEKTASVEEEDRITFSSFVDP